jgi:iron complex transport system permease protein
MTRRQAIGIIALFAVALLITFVRWMVDRDPIDGLGFAWPDEAYAMFRRNSIIIAAAIGAALAVSGVLLQALLRNPLASPFILGLSSGAGLGVMVAMYVGYVTGYEAMRTGTNALPALVGAMAVLAVVYSLGRRRGLLDPLSLVLVGVIASAMCGALIMFLQRLVPGGLRGELAVWMMGRIPQDLERLQLVFLCGLALFGVAIATMLGRAMDAATLGDDEARSVGLAIGPLRLGLFLLAGALAAVTVAIAGPIAFVGLIAPHAARLIVGPQHGPLVPAAALAGAALIIAADAASQALDFGAGRMPVGVFTALIGGPAFIWLLKTGKGQA